MKNYLNVPVILSGFAALMATAHAAPMTFVEVLGVDNSPTASASGAPFGVEVSDSFSADEFGGARADIGTLGVSAGGSYISTASFTDDITINGGGGVLTLTFDLDGSFAGSPAFLDILVSTSVDVADAFVPISTLVADPRSSVSPGDPAPAIVTSFGGMFDPALISYNPFASGPSAVALSVEPGRDIDIETSLVVYLAYEPGVEFEFSFEMSASGSFGSIVDFLGTAELVGVDAVDPITLAVLDDPTLSVNGGSGTDFIALAASNAGGAPVPVPAAAWLMGVGLAALLRKRNLKVG